MISTATAHFEAFFFSLRLQTPLDISPYVYKPSQNPLQSYILI